MGCPSKNEIGKIREISRTINHEYSGYSYADAFSISLRDFFIYERIRTPEEIVKTDRLREYTNQQKKRFNDMLNQNRETFEARVSKLKDEKRYEPLLRRHWFPFLANETRIIKSPENSFSDKGLIDVEMYSGSQGRFLNEREICIILGLVGNHLENDRFHKYECKNFPIIQERIRMINEKFGESLSLGNKTTNSKKEHFKVYCKNPLLIKLACLCDTFGWQFFSFCELNDKTIESFLDMLDVYEGKQYEMWNVFMKHDLNVFWEESVYYSTTRPATRKAEKIVPTPMDEYNWTGPTDGVHNEQQIDEIYRDLEEVRYFKQKAMHLGEYAYSRPGNLNFLNTEDSRQRESKKLASELCNALGVEFSFVSEEEAKEITKGSRNPYNGQASGFYFNGKIYFIEGKVTKDTVFHEFSHPIVKSIRISNRELFDNLFFDLMNTTLGQSIIQSIRENYGEDYDYNSDEFKEECIVFAIGSEINKLDTASKNILQKIWYAIKQTLRRICGNAIEISDLSKDTTISELAMMIHAKERFNITDLSTTNEDIISYMKDLSAEEEIIRNELNETQILPRINKMFMAIHEYIDRISSNEDLEMLKKLELDYFGKSDLNDTLRSLDITSDVYETSRIKNKADLYKRRVTALAKTFVVLHRISNDIKISAQDASNKTLTQDVCQEIYQLNRIIEYWQNQIKELRDEMAKEFITTNGIGKLLETTETRLREAKVYIDKSFLDIATDTIYDTIGHNYDRLKDVFNERLDRIFKNGNLQKYRDELFKEFYGVTEKQYERYTELSKKVKAGHTLTGNEPIELANLRRRIGDGLIKTKDEIRAMFQGKLGDTGYLNAKMEGFMYSKDPIVGGFATFFKEFTTRAMTSALDGYNEMFREISPLLDKIGYNKNKISMLGEKFLFRDKIMARTRKEGGSDETTDRSLSGEEEMEVLTFLNPFKNWRAELKKLENKISDLRTENKLHPSDENEKKYLDAKQELDEFKLKWMNQEYVPEYYEVMFKLKYTDTGKKAIERRNEIFEKMDLALSIIETGEYNEDDMNNYEQCIMELRNLSSIYDLNGKLKDQEGREIAKVLSDYNKEIGKFKRSVTDNDRFNRDYKDMLEKARIKFTDESGTLDSEGYNKYVQEWTTKNCRYEETDEFKILIQEALRKIMEADETEEDPEVREYWEEIFDRTKGLKDAYGVYEVEDMTDDTKKRIKELQELIEAKRAEKRNRIEELMDILAHEKDRANRKQIREQIKKLKGSRKLFIAIDKYNDLIKRIPNQFYVDMFNNQLEAYDDSEGILQDFSDRFGYSELTADNAEEIFTAPSFVGFLSNHGFNVNDPMASTGFGLWFAENHVLSEYISHDNETGDEIVHYYFRRSYFYDVKRPRDDKYIKKHVVRDPESGVILTTLNGTPGMRYTKSVVKDEYKTEKNSKTQDNRGNWLPRELADSPFRNEAYYSLTSDERAVLDCMVKHHLNAQEGASYGARLYLDAPRFRKDTVEFARDTMRAIGKNAMKMLIHRWKMFCTGGADDFENGVANAQLNLVYLDVMEDDFSEIPVSGKYALDADDVSLNILRSMERYTISLEREKALRRLSPIASAIIETLKGNNIESENVDKQMYIQRAVHKFIPKKENVRRDAVQALIDRDFKGETIKGVGKNSVLVQNLANLFFGVASKSFFIANVPSALKNSYGIKFQAWIESSSKKYVTPTTLLKGNHWSNDLMFELAFGGHYDMKNVKSMKHQIMEYFDMLQDNTAETMMDPLWRSVGTDIMEGKFLMMPRRWLEQQATVQVGAAMLYKKHILHTKDDGTTELVPYMDAFETDKNGQLVLKKGFDVSYDLHDNYYHVEQDDTIESIAKKNNTTVEYVTRMLKGRSIDDFVFNEVEITKDYNSEVYVASKEADPAVRNQKLADVESRYIKKLQDNYLILKNTGFDSTRNQIHQVNNDLGGSYAKFDQPDAHRTMLYKFIFFLKRYLTNMLLKRYRLKSSYNPGFGDVEKGFYISTLHWCKEMVMSCGKYYKIAPDSEKKAINMFITEMAMLITLPLLGSLLFGYDPDDEDKFKKLRAKSGALPTFLNYENTDREFNMLGWLELHTLHLMLQVRQENEQFNPFAGGLNQMSQFLDIKSVVFSPTVDLFVQSITDMVNIIEDNPSAYYTRDVGPYEWQDKESAKVWNHTLRLIGLTGTSVDPAMAIQNFQANANKIRR